jgi:subtilisin family serine protease
MATPHVAGLAALALSANPSLAAEALRALIVDGADRQITGADSYGGINSAATVAGALGYAAASASQSSAVSSGATFHQSSAAAVDQVFAESLRVPGTNRLDRTMGPGSPTRLRYL